MQMERLSEERKREKRKRENKPDSRLASVSCFSRSGSVAAKNRREKKSFFLPIVFLQMVLLSVP